MPAKHISFITSLLFLFLFVKAQDDGGYKMPPKAIADMLLAKSSPNVSVDDKGNGCCSLK
jgi:hypothetical protein